MRGSRVSHEKVTFSDVIRLPGVEGRQIDMEIELEAGDAERIYQKFAVRFAQNEQYHTAVSLLLL